MTADEAIKIAFLRRCQSGQLKPANEGPSLTDPALDPGRQRPVGLALQPAKSVEPAVESQQQAVGTVAYQQHQRTAAHYLVKLVAVAYQKTPAIRGGVYRLVVQLNTGKGLATEAPEEFVMVSGHIEDRKSTRLNSSHVRISYAVFCLKKKK